jgi:hypothetical protein
MSRARDLRIRLYINKKVLRQIFRGSLKAYLATIRKCICLLAYVDVRTEGWDVSIRTTQGRDRMSIKVGEGLWVSLPKDVIALNYTTNLLSTVLLKFLFATLLSFSSFLLSFLFLLSKQGLAQNIEQQEVSKDKNSLRQLGHTVSSQCTETFPCSSLHCPTCCIYKTPEVTQGEITTIHPGC